jgi:hypothetical protein
VSSALFLVGGLVFGLASAQTPASTAGWATADSYQTAHRFLRALYPGLEGRSLTITISPDRREPYDAAPRPLRAFVLTIDQPREGSPPSPVLTARFEFAIENTLFVYLANGTYVNELRRHRLMQWVGDHRGASITEIAAFLSELDAKFGPAQTSPMRREVLRQLRSLEPIVGPIELQELVFRDDEPTWRAEIVVSTAQGRRRYGVLFEPFEGRLTSIAGLGAQ